MIVLVLQFCSHVSEIEPLMRQTFSGFNVVISTLLSVIIYRNSGKESIEVATSQVKRNLEFAWALAEVLISLK